MSIKVDFNQAQQGRFVAPEGQYECIIKAARHDMTKGGTEYLHITLVIREDVEQVGQGEVIDWSVWKKKIPTQRDPEGFPIGVIQHISKVVKFDNGQEFATFDDWMKALAGKPVCVEIKHDEFNGRTSAKVAYSHETAYPEVAAAGFVAVTDDEDLPF